MCVFVCVCGGGSLEDQRGFKHCCVFRLCHQRGSCFVPVPHIKPNLVLIETMFGHINTLAALDSEIQ